MKKCLYCDKNIDNLSPQAKFCDDSCRKAYSRKNSDKKSDIEKSDIPQSEVYYKLKELFLAEGKSVEEVEQIMNYQIELYERSESYTIPVRFVSAMQ